VFAYSFNDAIEGHESFDQVIEGEAILHREPSEDSAVDKWVLQSVKTTNDMVTFTEGSVITPGTDADDDDTEEASSDATTEPVQQ
jgi:hypothetical protein